MDQFSSYIICATSRSGSTLLCKLLSDSGVAGRPDSYFHQLSLSAWARALNLPPVENLERDHVLSIIEAARLEGSGGTDVFGLRLMRKSLPFLMNTLKTLHRDLPGDAARIEASFGNTLYIHLTRRDKIAQAISLVKANQTGLWHRAPDGTELERTAAPRPPLYDADLIARHIDELTAHDDHWNLWFERERIDPVRVVYEDLAANPTDTLTRILDGLDLDVTAAKGVLPGVARLADDTSRGWAERFRAERGFSTTRA